MSYSNLSNYYQTLYFMTKQADFCSITEYENMIPFERDVFEMLMAEERSHMREAEVQQRVRQQAFGI